MDDDFDPTTCTIIYTMKIPFPSFKNANNHTDIV
jgi:hypothetical protein